MDNRIVVITGASAGVGRATAIEFARHGWRVVLLARGMEGLQGAQRDVEAAGGRAMIIPTDVADYDQVEAAVEKVEREWGPIEVWINNAMATIFCPATSIAPDDFKRATEVTYLGGVWGTLAALKRMKPRDQGCIVQIGSALAYRSIPLQAPYCGAKSALRGFIDSLRSELIHDKSNVHVTMVHLSAFNTPQFDWGRSCMPGKPKPLGKIFQPELAARGIYWAATRRRRELWVGFPAVEAIVGTRFIPGFLDRKLAHEAWDGQQGEEVSTDRRDNLYAPVPGDPGAHGRFDSQASSSDGELWLATHRPIVFAVLVLLVLLAWVAMGANH
jgi:NAD(P)-dependent dehydrogenase (short-subunit alcohol dehydrogenase family)